MVSRSEVERLRTEADTILTRIDEVQDRLERARNSEGDHWEAGEIEMTLETPEGDPIEVTLDLDRDAAESAGRRYDRAKEMEDELETRRAVSGPVAEVPAAEPSSHRERLFPLDSLRRYMDGEINPERVAELLDGDADVEIVDVREPVEFEAEHIPGSVNVPLSRLARKVDRIEPADRIVTVCPRGEASIQAARLISAYEGMDDAVVESMAGGLNAWEGPFESGIEGDGESDEEPARVGREED